MSTSSVEVSDEDKQWSRSVGDSGLPSSGRSSRGMDECESPVNLGEDRPSELVIPSIMIDSHLQSINEVVPCLTVDSHPNSMSEVIPNLTVDSHPNSISEVFPNLTNDSNQKSINEESQSSDRVVGNPAYSVPVLSEQSDTTTRLTEAEALSVDDGLESGLLCEKLQPVENIKPLNRLIPSFPEDCRNINSTDVSNFSTPLTLHSDKNKDCTFNGKSDSRPNFAGENDQLALETINLPSLPHSINHFTDNQESSDKSDFSVELVSQSPNLTLARDLVDRTILNSQPHSSVQTSLIVSERSVASSASPWPSLGNEFECVPSLASELESVAVEKCRSSSNNEEVANAYEPLEMAKESDALVAAPVKVIESLDKVIESLEKIMEPLELITESDEKLNSAARTQSDKVSKQFQYTSI